MPQCPVRTELTAAAEASIGRMKRSIEQVQAAFEQNDLEALKTLDDDLENALGEKERAFGALRQHTREHRCYPD